MKKPLILLLILIGSYSTVYNQIIKGTILDKFTKNPIDYAIVYINGTFIGTNANKNGNFELDISKNNLMPLTISALGYYSSTLTDFSTDKVHLVLLTPKVFELNEVVVNAKAQAKNRSANMRLFKKILLGSTLDAMDCYITNEKDISFSYDVETEILKAFTSKPILIDNRALGYKITFYLDKFEVFKKNKTAGYEGHIIFNEDLAANDLQKHKFERRRKSAFLGSKKHFFRALWENNLDSSGFTIYKATIPKRNPLEKLNYNDLVFQKDNLASEDSPRYLKYPGSLGISYKSKLPTSSIFFLKDSVYFDKKGNFDELGIRFSGRMGRQQIAEWLPNEYSIK
jgi:hypothetical protein